MIEILSLDLSIYVSACCFLSPVVDIIGVCLQAEILFTKENFVYINVDIKTNMSG